MYIYSHVDRWLHGFLIVIALQGAIALVSSPFMSEYDSESEEEWDQLSIMIRNPAYRLPTTTRPIHYNVSLTPIFDNPPELFDPFTFYGTVDILIRATEPNVSEIVLHCSDMSIDMLEVVYEQNGIFVSVLPVQYQTYQCEMPYSFLRIATDQPLEMGRDYIIRSAFTGNLQNNMRGFYRSWYVDGTNHRRWMATTQFQPGHAREAFPCYDEPGFKAYFDITINREPDFSESISNMPIRSNTTLPNGRIADSFHTTPLTSTYLLAFIVSHYEVVSENNNIARPFAIYARDNANTTGDWSLDVGERLLAAMEEYTAIPYYTMAPNMNMKQAAIPDFSAGAMENWGLLTYREAFILYDPENSNHFYKQRVANIVAHEIAHMWFGNLVTCAWWDNLWLNEGFARFYQYFLTNRVEPELGYETRFIVEQVHVSLLSDSFDTAHALTNPSVNDPATVSAHFSTITYARGASVLRMTQYLLGEETFVKGLRLYLYSRQFDVAEPHHLFEALDSAAREDLALVSYNDLTIDKYFRTWSEKAGHPLLTVIVNHRAGNMTITQARFEVTSGVSQQPSLWLIPITFTRAGAPDFVGLKPSHILSGQVTVLNTGTNDLEWIIFNKQQSGFYRINYDNTTWNLITRALRGPQRTVIHEYNRAQIVDDLFNFGRAGILSYQKVFNIISFLEFEDQYAPWIAAITGFNFVRRRLVHDAEALQKLHETIIQLSTSVVNRLGFSEIAGEPFMDGLLRMYVMSFLCNIDHPQCVSAARENFQNWRNGAHIPANMRPWVYCQGLRSGDASDFDYFWQRYLYEDLASETVVMLQAAGCTGDESSLRKYLDAITTVGFDIRPQDSATALSSALTSNEYNTLRAFEWLKDNIEQVNVGLGSPTSMLNSITQRLLNEEQIAQVTPWIEENREQLGASYTTAINGIQAARNNMQWLNYRGVEFTHYFDTGYVEEAIEELELDTTTTQAATLPPAGTTAPAVDGDLPDSANTAVLSFITLFVTLCIIFLF